MEEKIGYLDKVKEGFKSKIRSAFSFPDPESVGEFMGVLLIAIMTVIMATIFILEMLK